MTAEIIAIGSELTCGAKLDTNSQWLSRELEALGWTVTRHTALADDLEQIAAEFRAAAQRSQVVLVTGGLGPTLDDITRDALALAFDQQLIMDPESLQQIEALFEARGREMPERNRRQAQRPEFSEPLPNSCGTAPGVLLRVPRSGLAPQTDTSCLIAVLPGVPAEMKPMFEQQVRPRLSISGIAINRSVLRTFGYGESDAERLLGDLTARGRNPEVGITASEAVISLWITARSPGAAESRRLAEEVRAQIRERLGEAVYSEADDELHDVVARQLLDRGQRVALVEGSTTGGLLAHWLTEEPRYAACLASSHVYGPSDCETGLRTRRSTEWMEAAVLDASRRLAAGEADLVLLSSTHTEDVTDKGVPVRRGYVAIIGPGIAELHDCSMSGNLAIFRQRAARTALNRLRLALQRQAGH